MAQIIVGDYRFTRGSKLGEGAFGTVYRGYNHIELTRDFKDHENILKISDYTEGPNETYIYIVTELCDLSLQDFLKDNGMLSEESIKKFFIQIGNALVALHSKQVIHRDLKPGNILLVNKSNKTLESADVDDFIIKVADFGLAHFVDEQSILSVTTLAGTPMYMAPEVKKIDGKHVKYTKQGDIWSTGLIMLECFWSKAEFYESLNIEKDPLDANDYFNRGYTQYYLGKCNEAIADYTKAIELNPTHAIAYSNRGDAQHSLGKYNEAIADFTKAIELDPTYAKAYSKRGTTQHFYGKYNEAIVDYTKAIELNPTYAIAYNNRGTTQNMLRKYNEAIADYSKSIELDSTYANAYLNRGVAQNHLGKYNEAIADCTKAIELNPIYADAYYTRGLAQYNLGKYNEAIADYTKAIEVKPGFDLAINNKKKLMDKINFGK